MGPHESARQRTSAYCEEELEEHDYELRTPPSEKRGSSAEVPCELLQNYMSHHVTCEGCGLHHVWSSPAWSVRAVGGTYQEKSRNSAWSCAENTLCTGVNVGFSLVN